VRVVIDTNVFVSSARGGLPRKVIDLVDEGKLTLCISPEIVKEYLRVFQRLRIDERYLQKLLLYFEEADSILIDAIYTKLQLVEGDPDDDKFIECAAALKADYIITGDKALLRVSNYKKIKIVTPKQFLDLFYNIT